MAVNLTIRLWFFHRIQTVLKSVSRKCKQTKNVHFIIFVPDDEELLIERHIHTGMINPGDPWQDIVHDGPVALFVYRIRVRCDENYYGNKCNKLCVPRDNYFGHYRCESSGAQVCLDGWMGPECRTGELRLLTISLCLKRYIDSSIEMKMIHQLKSKVDYLITEIISCRSICKSVVCQLRDQTIYCDHIISYVIKSLYVTWSLSKCH